MTQISRIETLSNRIYLWNLCHLWEAFIKCKNLIITTFIVVIIIIVFLSPLLHNLS